MKIASFPIFLALLLPAQSRYDQIKISNLTCCEKQPYSYRSVMQEVRAYRQKKKSSSYYLSIRPKSSERDSGFGSSKHPSAKLCIEFQKWARSRNQAIYLETSAGSGLYMWNGKRLKGEWRISGKRNPFHSSSGLLFLVNIDSLLGTTNVFSMLRSPDLDISQMKKEALEYVKTFSSDESIVYIRTDPWHWLDGCGHVGPQAWERSRDISADEVSDVQWRCVVETGSDSIDCREMKGLIR
jgi:hypothetical protein